MDQNKGKIDVAAAQKFLGDHFDVYEGKLDSDERTLCGHIDRSPRGMGTWQPPYAPAGAVQNKVADAASAEKMTLTAALGHACGRNFKAVRAPRQASRVRLAEGNAARHERPPLDEIHGEVGRVLACWDGRPPATRSIRSLTVAAPIEPRPLGADLTRTAGGAYAVLPAVPEPAFRRCAAASKPAAPWSDRC